MDDASPMWGSIIILILLIIGLLLSAARKALEIVNENGLRKFAEDEIYKEKLERVLKLFDDDDKYINAAQFVISTIHIIIGGLVVFQLAGTKENWLRILFVLVLLLLVILFGSVIPIKMAILNPEKILMNTSGILLFFYRVFIPLLFITDKICMLFFWIFRINPEDFKENVTEDEIISIVNEGFEQGVLEDSEAEMISNIIELDDKEVRDVMTNRRKVISISAQMSLGEALRFMLGERYSRFPLYEEERDNIVGVLHFKDVTQHFIAGEDGKVPLKEIAREPYFVPDTQSVDTLFEDMQLKKIHMAIAVDEYGQMAGVVALEDILEEIVGNILDEYDEDERMILKQSSNRYIMRGMAPLDEVEDELGIRMELEGYDIDTLNGFLISLIGHLPGNEEKPVVHFQGYRFHVLDAKNNMIRTVRVVKEQEKNADQDIIKDEA